MPATKEMKIDRRLARKVLSIVDQGLCIGLGERKPGELCVEAAICLALDLPHSDDPKCVDLAVMTFKISLNDRRWSSNAARAKGMRRAALAQLGSKGIDTNRLVSILAEQTIRQIVPIALFAAAAGHVDIEHCEALRAAAKRCAAEGTRNSARDAAVVGSAADLATARAAATASAFASVASAAASTAAADNATASATASAANAASNAASSAASAASAVSIAASAASIAASAASSADSAALRDYVLSLSAEICVQALIECKSPGAKFLDLAEFKLKKPKRIRECEPAKN